MTLPTNVMELAHMDVHDEASATNFIKACERVIGPGFHPDTRAAHYEPGVFTSSRDEKAFDDRLALCFLFLPNVYTVSLQEYERLHPYTNPI